MERDGNKLQITLDLFINKGNGLVHYYENIPSPPTIINIFGQSTRIWFCDDALVFWCCIILMVGVVVMGCFGNDNTHHLAVVGLATASLLATCFAHHVLLPNDNVASVVILFIFER
jgi:hypothetical protein